MNRRRYNKRRSNNSRIKEVIFSHVESNLREYIIFTVIFLIGIIVGVIFINNVSENQGLEINNYITSFISSLKENKEINDMVLLKDSIKKNIVLAIILWFNKFLYKVFDPYLTIINSMPKVALGPIIIILCGANMKSIIIMALLISVIITISNVYNGFSNTDKNKIKLLKSLGATKFQILEILVMPSNYSVIINSLKINVSMSLIGVIMGEFLVSKKGIGYLINYGSQVFNLNLVISGIIILLLVSYIMYLIVAYIEKILIKEYYD